MSDQVLRGSCLCKSVRYEVRPPFLRFAHCYCSRCRKATGGVRSTNIAVTPDQFRWISGEELISRYDLPEARSFARQICTRCNCPVPHRSRNGEQVSSFLRVLWTMSPKLSHPLIGTGRAESIGLR
jgi:hypothetical protein